VIRLHMCSSVQPGADSAVDLFWTKMVGPRNGNGRIQSQLLNLVLHIKHIRLKWLKVAIIIPAFQVFGSYVKDMQRLQIWGPGPDCTGAIKHWFVRVCKEQQTTSQAWHSCGMCNMCQNNASPHLESPATLRFKIFSQFSQHTIVDQTSGSNHSGSNGGTMTFKIWCVARNAAPNWREMERICCQIHKSHPQAFQ
jgi:hypothetical protein